ncbi:Uncharacterised protein [Mycobacteroides abscessus subsp. abscessus]|uniref:hypothetical protein n=1 Tax=Mycobacteroides abscessus TaxID=36809 RepID=UPI0009264E8A|nr:hypothetical protein [Mycobacteroides abscessus]SIC63906.1 Uncharacterised protein [Mycobacteroides abscessus subsp. abscessus]SIC95937.1 Uncharacterised protein [Mycobacteroides abscessus subsp. abscessus]SID20244.1 Uncharacterised protein [Mycobacteroides abscessus subsp. abscessus]SID50332.1 Uncharacterised protein [Mycobacteroides abscessus subsp. abscessus]SKV06592.1 Uncharacterised protein [Mycobacteroides abscessus subsp. abscessus]
MTIENMTHPWTDLFYWVPAECLVEGVSTDDGQDVLSVRRVSAFRGPEMVNFEVYTPRRDNPGIDSENRDYSESRYAPVGELVELCVFIDTVVDLTRHPKATQLRLRDRETGAMTDTTREEWALRQRANGHQPPLGISL